MKICFVSQNGQSGKLTRDFPNCRTEFAWQLTLESDHFPIQSLLDNKANVSGYDVVIVILPKKLETIDFVYPVLMIPLEYLLPGIEKWNRVEYDSVEGKYLLFTISDSKK